MFDPIPASPTPALSSPLPLVYNVTLTLERHLCGSASLMLPAAWG